MAADAGAPSRLFFVALGSARLHFAFRLVQAATIAREEWAIEQSNVTWKTPCMLIG